MPPRITDRSKSDGSSAKGAKSKPAEKTVRKRTPSTAPVPASLLSPSEKSVGAPFDRVRKDEVGGALILSGVRENNLKNLSLSIPHDQLIVITGVSGSGKSTLAFDTVYAEGARRYIETFSPYTRQFLDRLHQPDIDTIVGVRPSLALEQRNRTTSSRSTVGTVTEINDYLKLIWSNLARLICSKCGIPVAHNTPQYVATELLKEPGRQLLVCFNLRFSGGSSAEAFLTTVQSEGFVRFYSRKEKALERLDSPKAVAELEQGELLVVVDRLKLSSEPKFKNRLISSISQAYHFGHGRGVIIDTESHREQVFSEEMSCQQCQTRYALPRPALFSFNSPLGACETCHGFGRTLEIDRKLIIPDPERSIDDGAFQCWRTPSTKKELKKLKEFCDRKGISRVKPFRELPAKSQELLLSGEKGEFRGVLGWFEGLKEKRHKMHVRIFLSRYRSESICPDCNGGRLKDDALRYQLLGQTLQEIWNIPLSDLLSYFIEVRTAHADNELTELAVDEVVSRLQYLIEIGLPYLTLDRQTRTLSGGESQRVCLTSIVGSRLVNTTLVLDEPTIALHPRDTHRLINILKTLRDRGNTVVVVEHEKEVMKAADRLIDLGPLSGAEGGEIVFQGSVADIVKEPRSLTGAHLAGRIRIERENAVNITKKTPRLTVRGAKRHNLRDIDLRIPLEGLTIITGVSGSGKSSLVRDCLYGNYQRVKESITGDTVRFGPDDDITAIEGLGELAEIVLIDQAPIGKSPRSNPGTYTKVWDIIRDCLAETEDARRLGLGRSAFSFNVPGGRCTSCEGAGYHRVEMQFLADVFVLCDQCKGSRFKDAVLTVRYADKNVQDLLGMTLDEVLRLFRETKDLRLAAKVKNLLDPLVRLGLGYLKLGQPLSEVSGGEAQRIKLASYLSDSDSRKRLFILDEPTTGLHPHNIIDLVSTLDRLIERGHAVLVVEHNQDMIAAADWMIELGPEGGAEGGNLILEGKPQELIEQSGVGEISWTLRELLRAEEPIAKSAKREPTRYSRKSQGVQILGAREHNLKNLSLSLPQHTLTAITGVSGSGKSTLAFDILFQEGQRRYIDCLSPYARQFLTQLHRAEVDRVDNIPPTISISQKTAPPVGISTIATTTELYQYLRLLYCKVGTQHCPEHDIPIEGMEPERIVDQIIEIAGSKRVFLFAPAVSGRKGVYQDLFQRAVRAEIREARVDGVVRSISEELRLERSKLHWISLLVASLSDAKKNRDLLFAAVEQALLLGSGVIEVSVGDKSAEPTLLSTERMCPKCHRGFRELDPQDFSFRSSRGVCAKCQGRGVVGAEVLFGGKKELCPDCHGARIGPIGRSVRIGGKRIFEYTQMTAPTLRRAFEALSFPERVTPVVGPILGELKNRLAVMENVGLDYLSLDRESSTLSGGEAQRLRLARALGSPLSGVCYIFDEPTIGLHPGDLGQLMSILRELRDAGNTVVIVEHDEETIAQADHIIDIGPTGGRGGGELVFQGSFPELLQSERSVTGQALSRREEALREGPLGLLPELRDRREKRESITITGATVNNLKGVEAQFLKEGLTVVCGVSGAGKSSLVHGALIPAVTQELLGKKQRGVAQQWKSLRGAEKLSRLIEIDQTPVGKTPTSTPASFLGIFDEIRKLYSMLPESQARGWTASFFSFNAGKGKCPTCSGRGEIKIPMSFLPDAVNLCDECGGMRYTPEALEVLYQGYSIGDILKKTMSEAKEIFTNYPKIRRLLSYVCDLGIGYLTLGQPTHTLSGGETQRLKIALELGSREAVDTLYVLDEPTIGLHMVDVEKLTAVLRELIAKGNTVVVIEHNLDVVASADHLLELGPGPGERGGEVIFSGTPSELLKQKIETPTRSALLGRRSLLMDRKLGEQQTEGRVEALH